MAHGFQAPCAGAGLLFMTAYLTKHATCAFPAKPWQLHKYYQEPREQIIRAGESEAGKGKGPALVSCEKASSPDETYRHVTFRAGGLSFHFPYGRSALTVALCVGLFS